MTREGEGQFCYGAESPLSPRFLQTGPLPEALVRIGTPCTLEKGQAIIPDFTCCYYLVEGLVAAYASKDYRNEFISLLMGDQALFLESDLIDDANNPATDMQVSFVPQKKSKLLKIPADEFRHLLKTDIEVAYYVTCAISQEMHAIYFLYCESKRHSLDWQIANLMKSFAMRYGRTSGSLTFIEFSLSHQMVAEILGANRVSVSKSMKNLKNKGLIVQVNDWYCISDMDRLTTYIESLS